MFEPLKSGDGLNFKNVFPPEDVATNVPIPDVVPIETNGYCSKCDHHRQT